jgi:hypothetical protein
MRVANFLSAHHLQNSPTWAAMQETMRQAAEVPDNPYAKEGAVGSQIAQWMLGEGEMRTLGKGVMSLVKGGSYADKLKAVMPVLQFAEKHPVAGRVLFHAITNATVGGTQAAAHGADAATVGQTAAVGAALPAVLEPLAEGAGAVINKLKPVITKALGEELPTLASQRPGAAPLAGSVAPIQKTPTYAAAQQEGAQRGIVNNAVQSARNLLNELNQARDTRWAAGSKDINLAPEAQPNVAPLDRQLPSGQAQIPAATASDAAQLPTGTPELPAPPPSGIARTNEVGAYEGDFPNAQPGAAAPAPGATPTAQPGAPTSNRVNYIEERPPNFKPIDVNNEVQGVTTYKQAADLARKHAMPVFDTFNKATGGEYVRLRKILDGAYSSEDFPLVNKTEDEIDKLFDQTQGKIDRLDFKTVKSVWKKTRILDAVHAAVNRAFDVSDPELATEADVWRGISGAKLMTGINRLTDRYGKATVDNIIGKGGLAGLTRIASLTRSPQFAAMHGEATGEVANLLLGKAGLIKGTLRDARNMVLHAVATSPRVARYMEFAIKNRVPPRVYAPIVAQAISGQENQK